MRTIATRVILAAILLSWCADCAGSAVVRPPRIPAVTPSPSMDQLLRREVQYIMKEGFPEEIPNESEQPIRSRTGAVYAAATCLKFANCHSPQQIREFVFRLLRDLTRTHVTGAGKTASGKPWGDHWQSALWAYQAAFGGWLLWNELPDDVRSGVVKMVTHEADRFLDLPPPYAEFLDTKAEENSWNSLILVFAAEVMPDHSHAARWRERGLEYTISSVATRADRKSPRIVAGRPLRTWVQGANLHDDFTMENHGFVHPDYMTTISQNLTHALVYRLLGLPVPQALLHNAQPSYDVLKTFTQRDCSLFYPNGTDWNLHHLDHTWNVHILAERVLRDREAGALAGCSLDTLEKMQARNPSGRLFVPGEYVTYATAEQHSAFLVASGLIAAKLWPPVSDPLRLDAVWERLRGVKVYDDGHLFISRTRDSISSFAWGLRIMGQTLPFTSDPILNPLNHSYVGLATELPPAGDKPAGLGITSAALDRTIAGDAFNISGAMVTEEAGGVAVTAAARHGNVRQLFSFTSLPTGSSVYMERFDGQAGPVFGGMVSLLEEPRWVYGTVKRNIQRGEGWLNVDDRLGFVISGAASPPLERQDHHSRTLFLNPSPRMGNVTLIITLPNATAEQTRTTAANLQQLETGNPLVTAVHIGGFLVVTNFDGVGHSNAITGRVRLGGRDLPTPVNGGATRIFNLGQ